MRATTGFISQADAEVRGLDLAREELEVLELLRGIRPGPGPNDWLSKVGLIAADDPAMQEIDAEGRRIRKSQKPI